MTEKVFRKMFNKLLLNEGKYSTDKDDDGNWTGGKKGKGIFKGTKYGISAKAYPNLDIQNLSVADAEYLFKHDYWDKCKCDLLPDAWSVVVSDMAFNAGVGTAAKLLQRAIFTSADGIIGNITLSIANRCCDKFALKRFEDARITYYKQCRTWWKHGEGWTNRAKAMTAMAEGLL